MLRACLKIVAVVALGVGIVRLREGQETTLFAETNPPVAWVRTVDGWEPSSVLSRGPSPAGSPALHPVLVASLQLGVSLFALLALPTKIYKQPNF